MGLCCGEVIMTAPNYYVVVFLVFAFIISRSSSILFKWTVVVRNELSTEDLYIHCRSEDDDLGSRVLFPGEEWDWSFRQNFFDTTRFWCIMRKKNGHVKIDVFWKDRSDEEEFYYRCNEEKCIWIAKDRGIYLKNIPENKDERRYVWDHGPGYHVQL